MFTQPCGSGGYEACSSSLFTSDKPTVAAIAINVRPLRRISKWWMQQSDPIDVAWYNVHDSDVLVFVASDGYARFMSIAAFQILVL